MWTTYIMTLICKGRSLQIQEAMNETPRGDNPAIEFLLPVAQVKRKSVSLICTDLQGIATGMRVNPAQRPAVT